MHELSGVLTLAHRDLIKLLRDRTRIVADFSFPLIFIGILGTTLQAGFGAAAGINLLQYVFTGVLAQTVWQSGALGVISLIADREQDFSQEIFVSPISRYSIILGVPFTLPVILSMIPILLLVAIYGGAFGVLVLSRLDSQRQANQIFPFVMLPQFFLAGVFNPIMNLPLPLEILSRLSPMRYAVDVMRDIFYTGTKGVALESLETNVAIIAFEFVLFMLVGTAGFVRAERNR